MRTPDEHPLRPRDFRLMRKHFGYLKRDDFRIDDSSVCRRRHGPGAPTRRGIHAPGLRAPRLAVAAGCPVLRNVCWLTVVQLGKPVASLPTKHSCCLKSLQQSRPSAHFRSFRTHSSQCQSCGLGAWLTITPCSFCVSMCAIASTTAWRGVVPARATRTSCPGRRVSARASLEASNGAESSTIRRRGFRDARRVAIWPIRSLANSSVVLSMNLPAGSTCEPSDAGSRHQRFNI